MERQRFREFKAKLKLAAHDHRSDPLMTHSDSLIVTVLLWAALHNKTVTWATRSAHWPGDLRPRELPSQPCMSRRLRYESVHLLIQRLEQVVRAQLPRHDIKLVDARPLTVGGCSKDPDARTGYGAGHKLRGYKLHTIGDLCGAVDQWLVTPMNGSEPEMAQKMLGHVQDAAYVIGDGNYDVNRMYDQAAERNVCWIALPHRRHAAAPGHRRHSPQRLQSWTWIRSQTGGRQLRKVRSTIERVYGWQGCSEVGLTHLPHHIRREHRVRVWVAAKLIIYHLWLIEKISHRKAAS